MAIGDKQIQIINNAKFFLKDLKSSNPNWKLVLTKAG